jgi:hypothetical protein
MTARPLYYRKESSSQTPDVARMQKESGEIWGGPTRNFMPSHIPKVKAYWGELEQQSPGKKCKGIEFVTAVEPDRGCRPEGVVYWSGPREGVRVEDDYAKIAVTIAFCNQLVDMGELE